MVCNMCPRKCNIERSEKAGFCGMTDKIKIARAELHFWEEPCISGEKGSGAIFFSGCPLKCVYCQNKEISSGGFGKEITIKRLSEIFRELEEKGAHNINLVTPTHYSEQITEALTIYRPHIPIVYNCSGYEGVETLKKLEGIVDIYLTDIKYFDDEVSRKYSCAEDYFCVASRAVKEMLRQQPENIFDDRGIMQKGVIIRHLVLPLNTSQSIKILAWIKNELPDNVIISLMSQYTPDTNNGQFRELDRKITSREYNKVLDFFDECGFENGYMQDISSSCEDFIPPFNLTGV